MPKIEGTITNKDDDQAIEQALAVASPTDVHLGNPMTALSDSQGHFAFQEEIAPGKWNFMGLKDGFHTAWKTEQITVDRFDLDFALDKRRKVMSDADIKAGREFFSTIMIIFVLLAGFYLGAHILLSNLRFATYDPSNQVLLDQIDSALPEFNNTNATPENLVIIFTGIKVSLDAALTDATGLKTSDKASLAALGDEIQAFLSANQQQQAALKLALLRQQIAYPPASVFWTRGPWRYIEIICWALAGVLVSKIITTMLYLRKETFYSSGIPMHWGQITVQPILVLVAMFILAQTTLSLTVGEGTNLTINLTDPLVMVAVAFILGTVLWVVWNFLQKQAERFTKLT